MKSPTNVWYLDRFLYSLLFLFPNTFFQQICDILKDLFGLYLVCPFSIILITLPPGQVSGSSTAASAKRRAAKSKDAKDALEEMQPKTCREKVSSLLGEYLKVSGAARRHSLTLSSLEFADELAQKLLTHAQTMEKSYLKISEELKDKKSPDETFEKILAKMEDKMREFDKLEARPPLGPLPP